MKIREYKLATADDVPELNEQVNALIGQGFQPFGSPFAAEASSGEFLICQAMVKTD